jgi:GMP synthase (glutamine-hydrolysing)
LDSASLQTRIDAYRDYGYFPPEEAESLKAVARERDVEWPAMILRRFVRRYAAR